MILVRTFRPVVVPEETHRDNWDIVLAFFLDVYATFICQVPKCHCRNLPHMWSGKISE